MEPNINEIMLVEAIIKAIKEIEAWAENEKGELHVELKVLLRVYKILSSIPIHTINSTTIKNANPEIKRECNDCKFCRFNISDSPYCAHPEIIKEYPFGLLLEGQGIKRCKHPEKPLWTPKS